MKWRDSILAMAFDARRRAENSTPMAGSCDPVYIAERRGARYAFGVMADELEYIGKTLDGREACERIRKLLEAREASVGFAARLKLSLRKRNLSTLELAARLGVLPSRAHEMQSGYWTGSAITVTHVAQVLDVDPSWLFSGAGADPFSDDPSEATLPSEHVPNRDE